MHNGCAHLCDVKLSHPATRTEHDFRGERGANLRRGAVTPEIKGNTNDRRCTRPPAVRRVRGSRACRQPAGGVDGYWMTDFGVASMRVTLILSRSIISGMRGAMFVFQWSLW